MDIIKITPETLTIKNGNEEMKIYRNTEPETALLEIATEFSIKEKNKLKDIYDKIIKYLDDDYVSFDEAYDEAEEDINEIFE